MLSAMRHHSHDSAKRSFIYYYSRDAEDESLKKNGARDAEEAEEARYIFSREEKIGGSIILYHRFIISYNNFLDFVGLDYYLYRKSEKNGYYSKSTIILLLPFFSRAPCPKVDQICTRTIAKSKANTPRAGRD